MVSKKVKVDILVLLLWAMIMPVIHKNKPIIVINPAEKEIVEEIYRHFLNDVPFPMLLQKARDFWI